MAAQDTLRIRVAGTGQFRLEDGSERRVWYVEEEDNFRRGNVMIRFAISNEMPYLLRVVYYPPKEDGGRTENPGYRLEYVSHTPLEYLNNSDLKALAGE